MGAETGHVDQADAAEEQATNKSIFARVLDWLRAGYPEGIPVADRFPVIAVLKRRMSDEDVYTIVEQLTGGESPAMADGVITHDEVEEHIAHVLREQPTLDEIRRVSARLAAGGWPLAASLTEDEADSPEGGVA